MDYSSYWSIDDFLSEEELISVQFKTSSFQNSQLNPNSPQLIDILQDDIMEIPLWLAVPLAQYDIVDVEVPKIFKEKFQKTLEADPCVINLREKSPYFYEVGGKLGEYLDEIGMIDTITDVFFVRMKEFGKLAYHFRIEDCSGLMRKMTEKELRVFNAGRKKAIEYRHYKEKSRKEIGYEETFRKLKKIKAN